MRMTKSKTLPFWPDEKSNQACFWSLTKKDGVFSALKGDRPFHSRPAFCNLTRRRTTSDTGRRALISSRKVGGNRMGGRAYTSAPRANRQETGARGAAPAIHRLDRGYSAATVKIASS